MKVAFLMDAVEKIFPEKDSSIVLMEEAFHRGIDVYYFEQQHLFLKDSKVFALLKKLKKWGEVEKESIYPLAEMDIVFMRKDPPVDMAYIYTTLLLTLAEKQGTRVINAPQSLRDVNEKLFTAHFPECCVPSLVSSDKSQLLDFLKIHHDIVLKPLDGMGGRGIFRIKENDVNTHSMMEMLSQNFTTQVIAQRYIPEIIHGDKRIILMHGEALPYAISRIAPSGETRANLAVGGRYIKAHLTDRDYWIVDQLSPTLKAKGLLFVGIDVIGDYLTEINVTSPTCLREINEAHGVNTAAYLFEGLF
jgi:glutathione synthase